MLLTRVLDTARAAEVERYEGPDGACCAALATPLVHDDRAVGALLVVTRRASRRLGAIDSEVIQRATRTLVERFLAPGERPEPARLGALRARRAGHAPVATPGCVRIGARAVDRTRRPAELAR